MKSNATAGAILVTGGSGFIGSHVVDELRELGRDVTVLDCFGLPHRKDVRFVAGDIRDRELMRRLAAEHTGIINLAAILGTCELIHRSRDAVEYNLLSVLPVFDAARDTGIPVVHVTVGNYWMNNPYSITKNAAEKIALLYNSQHGTRISVVRALNCYGERQKLEPVRKIIPNLILPALRGTEIRVYGSGEQRMDLIYVRDCAKILVQALLQDHGAWDSIFEAGTGDAPTVNSIVKTVLEQTQSSAAVRHVAMRPGEEEDAVVRGNPATLRPLGITAESLIDFPEGLRRTIDYYRSHEAEY